MFTPTRHYSKLSHYEMTQHGLYLLAEAINYSLEAEAPNSQHALQRRVRNANILVARLSEWKKNLPENFCAQLTFKLKNEIPLHSLLLTNSHAAQAMQMYHLACVLVLAYKPSSVTSLLEPQGCEQGIATAIDELCKMAEIATSAKDEPSLLTSMSCLRCAGTYVGDSKKRGILLDLINACQEKIPFPARDFATELKREWDANDLLAQTSGSMI